MKFQITLLALTFAQALSAGVYDLDDTVVLRDLESEGLYFEGEGSTESLSIGSSRGITDFTWLIERRDCDGVLDVTRGFFFAQPTESDENSELFGGYMQELLTLRAVSEGTCIFRIAYANAGNSNFSFDEHE